MQDMFAGMDLSYERAYDRNVSATKEANRPLETLIKELLTEVRVLQKEVGEVKSLIKEVKTYVK